ncbi:serine hydroxymethyltransferase [Pseudomonas aeruginosa]|uniref:serine hydroxymethyltransferase n=1 Tax=Pseudomonas aeruginosa TaxID=287 RepID=UPI0010A26553|nr:serine hydroxymethyltransferase [Pseudomonas aeruginosa]
MFSRDLTLARYDAELFAAMEQEAQRQEEHIELIASENYTSPAVMEAQGSVLTNKYAEGYPHKRYYGGCEYVDIVEQLAIDRAKQLFGADYANVQPHAGSQANAAVYLALLSAGDTILGMSLAHGGHLTHGASVSSSGKLYNGPRGGLILARANEEIEKKLNSAVFPGAQGGPLEHVIAAKAVCFKEALQPEFKTYQQQVLKNAQSMAQVFLDRGFDVVSGGTQNHLFLLSLIKQDITGKDADAALGRAFITVNKNSVPNDPRSPFVTSGLRIGTPAVTTRGFKEAECRELAGWICDILENMGDESVVDGVREKVKAICAKFPVYGN